MSAGLFVEALWECEEGIALYDPERHRGRTLDDALARGGAGGERFTEAELHRLGGELLLAAGTRADLIAARACFQRAIEVAREQRARAWELRAREPACLTPPGAPV